MLDAGLHRHDGQWWFPTSTVQLSFPRAPGGNPVPPLCHSGVGLAGNQELINAGFPIEPFGNDIGGWLVAGVYGTACLG